MERWQNKIAVVTGASAGIGSTIVQQLLSGGLQVIGLARRIELMEQIHRELPPELQPKFAYFKCDVSDVQSVNEAFDKIISQFGGVDILVNNAGVMNCGAMVEMDVAAIQENFNTNIMGVIHCTQRAFKSMKERSFDGHIIILNSIVGHNLPCFPTEVQPMFGSYVASKFALRAMTEMYRQEFKHFGTKIKITSISPGITDTAIIRDWLRSACDGNFLNVKDIANAVIYAISMPPHVQLHDMIIKPMGEFAS